MTWTRTMDGGHPVYSNGTYDIRRMDSIARGRHVWVLYRSGEPVMLDSKHLGARPLAAETLTQAKKLVDRLG